MAYIAANIIPSKYAESTATAQYTSTSAITVIEAFTATNTSASDVTLTAHLVSNGSTAGTSNVVLSSRLIGPGETYVCPELVGHVLDDGDFIATIAGTASAIVIRASGLVISG